MAATRSRFWLEIFNGNIIAIGPGYRPGTVAFSE